MVKYVLVTGGVLSGLGKGVIASSTGVIMKAMGFTATSIKIDPYLNIDAGLMSPFEHGEVYVLDDGGEVDLDLGNYERFLDITLGRDNNITTGKIYNTIIEKERRGQYLGKTVQVVPHVCNEIQDWIERVAKKPLDPQDEYSCPDMCIIELGGTVGDIESMPYVEALRQFQFRVGRENFCSIHVSLVPVLGVVGEHKTKPTQQSVRELRALGISPDIIVCRSTNPLTKETREKISQFCHVDTDCVIGCHDVSNIYRVPLLLKEQHLEQILLRRLHLLSPSKALRLTAWETFAKRYDTLQEKREPLVHIAMVGKYTDLQDAYASVIKALQHAAIEAEVAVQVDWIDSANLEPPTTTATAATTTITTTTTTTSSSSTSTTSTSTTITTTTTTTSASSATDDYQKAWGMLKRANGILVPGGFGDRGVEGKILAIRHARENKIPFLGICLGMQLAVIEFARNVLGLEKANSEEFEAETKTPVVIFMPEVSKTHMGATMRLGKRTTSLKVEKYPDSLSQKLYNSTKIDERHRHRYEVNPALVAQIEEKGLQFVGEDETKQRMEIIELPQSQHPFFYGTQYHPEFKSRPGRPSPPFVGLVLASAGKLQEFFEGKKPGLVLGKKLFQ